MGMFGLPPEYLFAYVIVIFLAIGIHEYAHAKFADMAGDLTPRAEGRVTLDLTKHFEVTGTLMMIFTAATGFGLGWGKPVNVNPGKMKNPRWDHFTAVLAGPVSNLVQAGVWAVLYRIVAMTSPTLIITDNFFSYLLMLGVVVNLGLFLFNLLPLGPLDGHWLVGQMIPALHRERWYRWHRSYGRIALLVLVIGSQILYAARLPSPMALMAIPRDALFRFMVGGF